MSHIKGSRYAAVAVAVVCLLAGCSKEDSGVEQFESPQVASLRSDGPKQSAPADVNDQRPLVPLDATDEEHEAMWKPFAACVLEKGGPGYEDPRAVYRNGAKGKEVRKACQAMEPETYEARQLRKDVSAFEDNQRQWYQCAKKAGYKLTAPQDHYQFGITEVGPNGDFSSPKMEACRKEAFKD